MAQHINLFVYTFFTNIFIFYLNHMNDQYGL